jgi:hypothetical protein
MVGRSVVGGVVLAAATASASPANFTFTGTNPGFVAVTRNGIAVSDVAADVTGARDVVGSSAEPVLYVASDASHVYFRIRVNSDALVTAMNLTTYAWGCALDTNGNVQKLRGAHVRRRHHGARHRELLHEHGHDHLE